MKNLFRLLAVLVSLLPACNYTEGQCWVDTGDQGYGGTPDGPILPTGAGGYGSVPPEPQDLSDDTEPPECNAIGSYSPSLFKFTTTVQDDGEGEAGGYQEATAPAVKFVDGRQAPPMSWSCRIFVGMPLRTQKHGKISASRAAEITADVLTTVSGPVMHSRASWLPASFCIRLEEAMLKMFKGMGLGATVIAQ